MSKAGSRMDSGTPNVESGTGKDEDRLLRLLADERRRCVVATLREATPPVAMTDLAERVADREDGQPSPATVRRSLYHCDVPKLAEADVVEHDRDASAVEPGAAFEAAVEFHDALPGFDGGSG